MTDPRPSTSPAPRAGEVGAPGAPGEGDRVGRQHSGAPRQPDHPHRRTSHASTSTIAGGGAVRAGGLLAVAMLGSLMAALLGAAPMADWAAAHDLAGVSTAADAWRDLTRQLGLDRPYDTLRHLARNAETARFATGH